MRFKPYPKYKPSGLEWLGDVPEGWNILALKYIVYMQSGEQITADSIESSGAFPVYGGNGLRGYTSNFTHDGFYALIGRQGALCGNINYASEKFWASEHAVVVSPTIPCSTRWIGELLRSMDLGQYSITAAQPGLSVDAISKLRIAFAPLNEQIQIATFLDRETAKIDTLIAKQEKLIELLKEKRQAMISHAVTKGLDPSVPMKHSGVEWLGEVPTHWSVCQIKRVLSSSEYGISASLEASGEIPILRMGNIVNGQVSMENLKFIDVLDDAMTLTATDILFNRTNSLALVGKVGMYKGSDFERVGFASYLVRLRANAKATPEFLTLLFNSDLVLQRARADAIPAIGQANLNPTRYGTVVIPLPPIGEQEIIVGYLGKITTKIDTLIAKAEQAIALQKEHRTALISAAVTGKIDVRDNVTERKAT